MSIGNNGITAIFKWHCHLPRERILEDIYKEAHLHLRRKLGEITKILERKTEKILQAFKAAQKSKRALNTLRVLVIYSSCTLCS